MTKQAQVEEDGKFVQFRTEHDQKNTAQHWQLKDLVSFGSSENQVYIVDQSHVIRYNLDTQKSDPLILTNHAPSSMTVNGSYLATGTENGELTVYSLGEDGSGERVRKMFQASISRGKLVVNSLHIVAKEPGSSRLYASLNDTTVRCYSLPSMTEQQALKHQVAVNYSAESPDGNSLVTVGDNPKVNFWRRDSSGRFQLTAQIPSEATMEGMCCAWNEWGNCFSTGHQCGHVIVWDSRMPPGQTVACHKVEGAVRSVKFSCAPVDLMAFGEHDSAFHVVDSRKYMSRHTVRHADNHSCDISGLAFSPGGSRLALGIKNRGIQEWSIDGVSRRGHSCYMAS